jgi:hypothetical protein
VGAKLELVLIRIIIDSIVSYDSLKRTTKKDCQAFDVCS